MTMPDEDGSWPKCQFHAQQRHWCDFTRNLLVVNDDADTLTWDMGYVAVPVVPQYDLYADVTIGEEIIEGLAYMLKLVMPANGTFPLPDEETLVDLGVYTRGEGRIIIFSL